MEIGGCATGPTAGSPTGPTGGLCRGAGHVLCFFTKMEIQIVKQCIQRFPH